MPGFHLHLRSKYGGSYFLKPGDQSDLQASRTAGRYVRIAVRVDEISLVGKILQIGLQTPVLAEVIVNCSICLEVRRQDHRVIYRGIHIRAIAESQTGAQPPRDLVFIPKREHISRNLSDPAAGGSCDRSARDPGILPRISAGDRPAVSNAAVQAGLESGSPLASRLQDLCRIARIIRPRICTVETIYGRSKRNFRTQVPLNTGFIISEFLGLDLLRDVGQ